jgi:threonine-phosphate decarboxylase
LIKSKKLILQELNYLKANISKLDKFDCYDSTTNFILIKTKIDSDVLQKKLLQKKILIRGLDHNFIRIAVKKRKENQKLLRALKEI